MAKIRAPRQLHVPSDCKCCWAQVGGVPRCCWRALFLLPWHWGWAGFAECPLSPGAKHKSMLEGHGTQLRRGRGKLLSRAGHKSKRIGNKGSINIQNKAFHCQVCEIYVNSETQLKQVTMPWECPGLGVGAQGLRVLVLDGPCRVMGVPTGLSWTAQ